MVHNPDEKYDQEEDAYHFSEDFSEDDEHEHYDAALSKGEQSIGVPEPKAKRFFPIRLIVSVLLVILLGGIFYKLFKPSIEPMNIIPASNHAVGSMSNDASSASAGANRPLLHVLPPVSASPSVSSSNNALLGQRPVGANVMPLSASNAISHASLPADTIQHHPNAVSNAQPGSGGVSVNHLLSSLHQVGGTQQGAAINPLSQQVLAAATTSTGSLAATTAGQSQQHITVPLAPPSSDLSKEDLLSSAVIPADRLHASDSQIQAKMQEISSENQRLMNKLQMEYAQKVGTFAAENKFMEEEMHRLNARVAEMEAQMHQLLRSLQSPPAQTATPPVSTFVGPRRTQAKPAAAQHAIDVKIPYNIQAIIPGRAWLLADSGETVTVTEGDHLKGFGRVTRIDPYDGVVDINVGNKVVSLSYSNSGA